MGVSYQLAPWIMHDMTDELATCMSPVDRIQIWTCSGMTLVDMKFNQGLGYVTIVHLVTHQVCYGVCVTSWLHVSWIRPTHWRRTDDLDINWRHHGIRNDPVCNNCDEGPETATHFIYECSRCTAAWDPGIFLFIPFRHLINAKQCRTLWDSSKDHKNSHYL